VLICNVMLTLKMKFLCKGKKFCYTRSDIVTALGARVKIAGEGEADVEADALWLIESRTYENQLIPDDN
jgi:hypothetical protein